MALVRRHLRHAVEESAFGVRMRAGNVERPFRGRERLDDGEAFGIRGAFGLFGVFEGGALWGGQYFVIV